MKKVEYHQGATEQELNRSQQ